MTRDTNGCYRPMEIEGEQVLVGPVWTWLSNTWWTGLGAVGSVIAMALALIAVWQARKSQKQVFDEGRRAQKELRHALVQPALICQRHESPPESASGTDDLIANFFLTNDGLGPAKFVIPHVVEEDLLPRVDVRRLTIQWLNGPDVVRTLRTHETHTLSVRYPTDFVDPKGAASKLPIRFSFQDVFGRKHLQLITIIVTTAGMFVDVGIPSPEVQVDSHPPPRPSGMTRRRRRAAATDRWFILRPGRPQ